MKNLIITTDFSEKSDICFQIAKYFDENNFKMKSVHLDNLFEKFMKLGLGEKSHLAKVGTTDVPLYLLDELKAQAQRLKVSPEDLNLELIKSDNFELLVDYLKQFSNDSTFICTATRSAGMVERILFGGFIEKLIFQSSFPIIIAKKELEHKPQKIGICFDPVQDGELLLSCAESFVDSFGCAVDIIYVESFDSREIYKNVFATQTNSEKDKNNLLAYKRNLAEKKLSEYKERFEKKGVECDVDIVLTVGSDPATDLKEHLKANPVDFIFIEPHPGFRKSFRFNSTSYDLIKNINENFVVVGEVIDGK